MQRMVSCFLRKSRSSGFFRRLATLPVIGQEKASRWQCFLLWIARILWSSAILALLAEAFWHFTWVFAQYQHICDDPLCGVTPLQVQELQTLQLPMTWYITYQMTLLYLLFSVWSALGLALFWQTKCRTGTKVLFAWLVSLVLVAYAGNITQPSSPPPPFALISWMRAFGETFLLFFLYWYWRIAQHRQRTQTRAILFTLVSVNGITLFTRILLVRLPHHILLIIALNTLFTLVMLLVPLVLGRAIARYHFWEMHMLLNRTLTYGALTACVLGMYILIVGGLGMLLQRPNNPLLSLLATGTIAAVFQPLRAHLHTLVNRLLYGERDNPSAVLRHLGQQLETTLAPEAVLQIIVKTIAQTLKLPGAALSLKEGTVYVEVARYGDENTAWALTLPLVSQGNCLGILCLAARAPGERFSSTEIRMLSDIARQASIAIHAGQATRDLQHARERLITTREEERRRLQRDLHDGLGPALASFSQRIDAACQLVFTDPHETIVQLQALKKQTRASLAEMRRMVYALCPPLLEELGLLAAIREQSISGVWAGQIEVILALPEELPLLSAAVEVAVYHIIQEALTNIVHHARASICHLCLFVLSPGLLAIEINDDGVGLPDPFLPGVGINSMKERSIELGGTFSLASPATGGTHISIRIPYPS